MKYEITSEDQKIMAKDLANDRVLKHLRNLSFYKFAIGDVLIREEKFQKYDGTGAAEWKVYIADCKIPYKYVYVFENELGVGYIRRLSVNGRKFVERPICITEFDPDRTRFLLDPEYADHMLLSSENEEFDTKSRYNEIKKKREQINRKNKKLRVQIDSVEQAIAWFKTLKIGDQVWVSGAINDIAKEPFFVFNIDMNYISLKSTQQGGGWSKALYAYRLAQGTQSVFTERPIFIDEVIN